MDPALIERPAEYDDFPQYTARPPSPDDFDELTGARPPLPPRPGSRGNPFVIEDAEPPETTPKTKRRLTTASARQPERRSARMLARPAPIPPAASGSSRRHISVTSSLARPPAYSSRAPAAPPKQRTPTRKSTGGGRSPKKTAANGFSPIKSSPLTQVLYRAPSQQSVTSGPVAGPSGIQHASWDTRARKHSIEDASMSDSSSDSGGDYY